jgi:hypothetical protein
MPSAYKTSQVQGTAGVTTYATLYNTASVSMQAVVSSIVICNTGTSTATYRIAIMDSAGTPAATNWLAYDAPIAANNSVSLTLGVSLQANRFIRISSSANTVTFSAFVSEIT